MDMIGRIRRLHSRKNKSEREISRMTGLSRNTVSKWLHGEVDGPPKYRRGEQPGKLTQFHEALKQALKADARRPRHERRTAKALYGEIKAAGYDGGYTRVTDFIRAWRQGEGQGAAVNAFIPLVFELGEAYQFDWSEEGLVVGGIYYRVQVAHMKLCASRAFWLVAYSSQGHDCRDRRAGLCACAHYRRLEFLAMAPTRRPFAVHRYPPQKFGGHHPSQASGNFKTGWLAAYASPGKTPRLGIFCKRSSTTHVSNCHEPRSLMSAPSRAKDGRALSRTQPGARASTAAIQARCSGFFSMHQARPDVLFRIYSKARTQPSAAPHQHPLDPLQLLPRQPRRIRRRHRIHDLPLPAGPDQHRGHALVPQYPGQRHLRERLSTLTRQAIKRPQHGQALGRDVLRLEEHAPRRA